MIKEAVLIFVSAVTGSSLGALLVYKDLQRRLKQAEEDIDRLCRRKGPTRQFKMPTYCMDCGAYLMGGATAHKPGCDFQAMIDDTLNRPGQ